MSTDEYVAYIGIDWADRKHDVALYDCASDTKLKKEIDRWDTEVL